MMYVICPHCDALVEIKELNCRIFRHAIMKKTHKQINPHASKSECERLFKQGKVYGCAKPFRIDEDGNAVICDYI